MKRDIHEFQFLKDYYGMDESQFCERIEEPTLKSLPNPFLLGGSFQELVDHLKQLIEENRKVVIYGDYDVDGLTSTAILVGSFNRLGLDVGYYIPSRYIDGYGLSRDRVKQFFELNYDVIITVDNGISEIETIEYAKSLGLEVIIVDHHEVTKSELPSCSFIYQQYVSQLTDYNISAACLALFVSYGLLGEYDKYYVTLAGLAVFSDSMPLVKTNLILARLALQYLRKYRYRPLGELLNYDSSVASFDSFSYDIIPALNSIGRIDKTTYINKLVKYLLSSDESFITLHARKIKNINELRKTTVKEFDSDSLEIDNPIIFSYISLPLGIVGLLANKLVNIYNKPIVVFTDDPSSSERYTGSIRTPEGYETAQVLKEYCPFLYRFGGHAQAAGFTVDKDKIDEFKMTLSEKLTIVHEKKVTNHYIMIDNPIKQVAIVEEFGPYGNGLEKPLFGVKVEASKLQYSRNGLHLLTKLKDFKIVEFNCPIEKYKNCAGQILFIGNLKESSFNGFDSVDLNVIASETCDIYVTVNK